MRTFGQSYPCLHPYVTADGLETTRACNMPSVFYARGNDALYGHLCRVHWKSLPEHQQALYAPKDSEPAVNS